MSEYLLEMKGITKVYPGVVALDRVDFSVKPGEVHASWARTAPANPP